MIIMKKEKDLDNWLNTHVKILMHYDGFYEGTLISEQKNGLLIQVSEKLVYVPYESVLALEQE